LPLDNYYDSMHNYNHRNPLLLPTLLFIPQNTTLFSYTQTSIPRTSSYPIIFFHTPPSNKRSKRHRSSKNVIFTTCSLKPAS
jgi:hypothetical protein